MIATKMTLLRKLRQKYMIRRENNQQKLKMQSVKKLTINLKEEKLSFLKAISMK